MGKLLKIFLIVLLALTFNVLKSNSQTITPIYDIQYNASDPGGPSPLVGTEVTIQGVVTVSRGAFSGSYFFIQDKSGPWNGLEVYLGGSAYSGDTISEGDSLQVTGTVGEYHQMTQIGSVTEIVNLGTNKWIEPVVVSTLEVDSDDSYECVLVSVIDVTVTNGTISGYTWIVDDGSGPAEIGTRADDNYFYEPADNDVIGSITGVIMDYDGDYELQPRAAYDFGAINGVTMIKSIQQVRYCEDVAGIDTSYFEGDTVLVRGIVTVPSGLFYAGDGVTVYIQDSKGGPWSGVLAFADTPTGIDVLYEGDEIQVKCVVTEYEHSETGVSTTELRGIEAFELLQENQPVPEPVFIQTIELDTTNGLDSLAEKYEGVLVKVQNARVDSTIRWSYYIRDFSLDDGSGGVTWAESRSDSLVAYEPAVGTLFQEVTGVVYHRFGHYMLLPRFTSDLILSSGPPIFGSVDFDPPVPSPEETVTITASVQDESQVVGVTLHYQLDGAEFQTAPMALESGFIYTIDIGPFADQTVVNFYVTAEDNDGNIASMPEDAPASTYTFGVVQPSMDVITIAEAKIDANNDFKPDLLGTVVKVQGIITGNGFADYYTNAYFQDKTGGCNLYVDGQFMRSIQIGDSVEVVGRVNLYNGLTEIQPDDTTGITILGPGTLPEPVVLTCADMGEQVGELHECELVVLKNVTITGGAWPAEGSDRSLTITDETGSTTLRIDKDTDIDGQAQPEGAINVVGIMSQYDSSDPYSSGYQLLPRSMADISLVTSVAENDGQLPLVFGLSQNFPNPFNPTTTIHYSIARDCHVKLEIYNVMGQKIKTLFNSQQKAGHNVVNWDGTNDAGINVSSGIYMYRIQAADFVNTKKMLLIK